MRISPKAFVQLVKSLLMQGLTPDGISLSITLGFAGALFPILGTTSIVCLLLAAAFRLNHPIMQSINWLALPLHIALIFPFLRVGERIFGATPLRLNLSELAGAFHQAPGAFFARFSRSFLHVIGGWLVVMAPLALLLHLLLRSVLRCYARREALDEIQESQTLP